MSKLSNEEIEELLKLFESELGLKVSPEEAYQHAEQFLNLLIATYRDDLAPANNSPP